MGIAEGTLGIAGAAADWLGDQEAVWGLSSRAVAAGLAGFRFAFHDGEEMGPRMLARIARRTGLRPEDL